MSKKKHAPHPTPPANRTTFGPGATNPTSEEPDTSVSDQPGTGFAEQDPQRRLGNYEGAGEHSFVQPGGKNDAQRGTGGK